jgi:RNA polymerase sigma-70 factor, ECF subfamily
MSVSIQRASGNDDELELIEAFQRGRSEAAARLLIERFSPRLLRTVARVLGEHAADAEDVLQEGWMRGLGAIDQYRGESAFGTWMTRIAIRCALDHLRKQHTRTPVLALDEARMISVPVVDHDLMTDIERAITRLSPHERSVLVMHDLEGLTHQEIAEIIGIAVGTSKVHLFNARRKLRRLLNLSGEASA